MSGADGHDTVESLLRRFVQVPSVNPMGRALGDQKDIHYEHRLTLAVRALLEMGGVATHEQFILPDRNNLWAIYEAPKGRRTLLWDVHQDTVPVDGMTIDPFGAVVENGRLYGRGACDVKGSMAAMLFAFLRLARERPASSASVVLVFTVDEEYTHLGSSALAHKLPVPHVDLAIVAEPTGLNLVTTHKGAVRWRIATKGIAVHSATPHLGDNAIYRMSRVVAELEKQAWTLRESEPDEVLGPPSMSVGTIVGGVAANVVPESCTVEIDRRLIPGEHPDGARQRVIDKLKASLSVADVKSLEFEPPWVRMPALRADAPPEILQILSDVTQKATGRKPDVTGVPFGTDAGPLGQAGVKCVVFGPGDIAQAHTKDEWIELAQVHTAAEAYYQMAVALG